MILATTLAFVALLASASASIDPTAKDNVVVYWGQGPNQKPLLDYCQQASIDTIIISFVYLFPQQGNGYIGTNFGNQCSGQVYPGPGVDGVNNAMDNHLHTSCPLISQAIPICQSQYRKKIILSVGGGVTDYQLTGTANGIQLANQLWTMFGPRNDRLVARGLPRPFDQGTTGVEVDGFDLDIERQSTDNQAGYIAMAAQLRQLFRSATKPYYLTASPQCTVPDSNMDRVISSVQFDYLFIQFYNTAQCSAAAWVAANPNYGTGSPVNEGGFSLSQWSARLRGTPSQNARLFISLPGGPSAANPGFYIGNVGVSDIYRAHMCTPNFGGISVWEATAADNNPVQGKPFYQMAKATAQYWSRARAQICGGADPAWVLVARQAEMDGAGHS